MSSRGISPVVGVVCLLAVTVGLAAVVGASAPLDTPSEPTVASLELTVDSSGELGVTHRSGDAIDPDAVSLRIRVDGEPLERQPSVPFFSARGFESAPTGAFNSETTSHWRAGETASLRIAETNEPSVDPGDSVVVRIYVDDHRVANLEATA